MKTSFEDKIFSSNVISIPSIQRFNKIQNKVAEFGHPKLGMTLFFLLIFLPPNASFKMDDLEVMDYFGISLSPKIAQSYLTVPFLREPVNYLPLIILRYPKYLLLQLPNAM